MAQIFARLQAQAGPDDPSGATVEKHKVTFWKNGFQLDDGEFRPNTDPANQQFLAEAARGQIPRELRKPGIEVDVEIDDHREDDYKAKPKPVDVWAGGGRRVDAAPAARPPPPAAAAPPPAAPAAVGRTNFAREGGKTTRLQLLFPTGGKVAVVVPETATIGELKGFVAEARPDFAGRRLTLRSTYPPKELVDDAETIEEAGLKMAQIAVTVA